LWPKGHPNQAQERRMALKDIRSPRTIAKDTAPKTFQREKVPKARPTETKDVRVKDGTLARRWPGLRDPRTFNMDPYVVADAALRAAGQHWPESQSATSAGSARGRSSHSDYARAPAMAQRCSSAPSSSAKAPDSDEQHKPPKGSVAHSVASGTVVPRPGSVTVAKPQGAPTAPIPHAKPDGEEPTRIISPWRPTLREEPVPHAAAAAAPATKKARSETWAEKRDAQSDPSEWLEGAVHLSNQVQMKIEKFCTKCGANNHFAGDCMAAGAVSSASRAGAAAPEPASSSVGPQGAPTAEPAGSMPPPSACPKGKVIAQGKREGNYARYTAGRTAKAMSAEKGKSSRPPAPEVPESAYGIGTYDTVRTERAEAKGKTKKGKSKKGKGTRSESAQDPKGWWNRSWWEHEQR